MKKFEKVTEPMAMDFYSIEMNHKGEKQIHISGYTGYGDCWRCTDVCWFIVPLAEFVRNVSEDENYVDMEYCEHKQYEEDLTDEDTVKTINHYFDGKPADYILSFSEITLDTPCGNYVAI